MAGILVTFVAVASRGEASLEPTAGMLESGQEAPANEALLGGEREDPKARSLASYTMGVVYDLQGYTEKAMAEFEKSAEYDDNYAAHLRLGADYARLGKIPEAEEELRAVLEHDPQNIQARYLLALIYSSQKDFDKAAGQYEAILQSFSQAQPQNKEIYAYLGQLYYSQKEYDKAIRQFETFLSLDPGNADVIFLLGSLYLERDDTGKAKEYFLRCTKVQPDHVDCLNSLGYLYAEEGDHLNDAEKLIQKALEIDPENGAYLDSLAWVYFKKGEYEKAISYLNEADRFLDDPIIYEHLGDVYAEIERPDEARKYWRRSLELLPGQDRVLEKIESLQQSP